MARRVEKLNQDGIYAETIVTGSWADLTEEERAVFTDALASWRNLDGYLAIVLKDAREIQATTIDAAIRKDARTLVHMLSAELPWLRSHGLHDDALRAALTIGRIIEKINVRPFESAVRKENKRDAANRTRGDEKKNLARQLWAEYARADLEKRGAKGEALKEIGEIIQQRLELTDPVRPETVRGYLKQKKTGGD